MTKKEQRHQEWIARVADYQASGQTMKAWCNAQGVTKDQLKYWIRTLKPRPARATKAAATFVPLTLDEPAVPAPAPSLLLHVGTVRIELKTGFDPMLLREAVSALATSC